MPRIRPSEILRARTIDKRLPSLLPICRDIASARNELRWMHEHATSLSQQAGVNDHHVLLRSFVARRSRGEPIQYILGSEFFGDLEIKVRPGVLIPRQETAASVSYLVSLLRPGRSETNTSRKLRVLDLCTGSGCIPLHFHDQFYKNKNNHQTDLELIGVDISPQAMSLSRENLLHQIALSSRSHDSNPARMRSLNHIGFVQADVLKSSEEESGPPSLLKALSQIHTDPSAAPTYDILISNPPYISPSSFLTTTSRSVRNFEPRIALVPPNSETGDLFYPKLLQAAKAVSAKIILFEVADFDQAKRVAALVIEQGLYENVEIWRDEPSHVVLEGVEIGGKQIRVRGRGHGRSVFARRTDQSLLEM